MWESQGQRNCVIVLTLHNGAQIARKVYALRIEK